MKKMMALAMAAVMTMAALTGCGGSSDSASGDVPVIGISQYGQHASLDNCRRLPAWSGRKRLGRRCRLCDRLSERRFR